MSKTLSKQKSRDLTSWFSRDPFAALREEMNDALSRFTSESNGDWLAGEHIPSIDLSETGKEIEVKMNVPGVQPDEIEVEVSGNTLRVSGEHKEEREEKGRKYHRTERQTGYFSRTIALPSAVSEDKVEARCHNGTLTITLPKASANSHKKITVKS